MIRAAILVGGLLLGGAVAFSTVAVQDTTEHTLEGRVLDEEGAPLAGVPVQVVPLRMRSPLPVAARIGPAGESDVVPLDDYLAQAERYWEEVDASVWTDRTDLEGRWSVDGLDADARYRVAIAADFGWFDADWNASSLRPGRALELTRSPTVTVALDPRDELGQPISNASVSISAESPMGHRTSRTIDWERSRPDVVVPARPTSIQVRSTATSNPPWKSFSGVLNLKSPEAGQSVAVSVRTWSDVELDFDGELDRSIRTGVLVAAVPLPDDRDLATDPIRAEEIRSDWSHGQVAEQVLDRGLRVSGLGRHAIVLSVGAPEIPEARSVVLAHQELRLDGRERPRVRFDVGTRAERELPVRLELPAGIDPETVAFTRARRTADGRLHTLELDVPTRTGEDGLRLVQLDLRTFLNMRSGGPRPDASSGVEDVLLVSHPELATIETVIPVGDEVVTVSAIARGSLLVQLEWPGEPIEGALLDVDLSRRVGQSQLHRHHLGANPRTHTDSANLDDGSVLFENLEPGAWSVRATLRSVTRTVLTSLGETVEVGSDRTTLPIRGPSTYLVRLRLPAFAEQLVQIAPTGSNRSNSGRLNPVALDPFGRGVARDLLPGLYRIGTFEFSVPTSEVLWNGHPHDALRVDAIEAGSVLLDYDLRPGDLIVGVSGSTFAAARNAPSGQRALHGLGYDTGPQTVSPARSVTDAVARGLPLMLVRDGETTEAACDTTLEGGMLREGDLGATLTVTYR
ncbi:hypothetical protein Pla163_31700 [Planctomycetes bacterium Pla163]|uniref:Carboxypeptidase regulatory-like domain-containing protein n=1 Tax=Rohdeia mirabilis TaxID=2528008 RepID=A0A518D3G8_9BACT|nr:hypothetical protein Pla163_31700 [Planctomycetes bacterium Pla163]